MNRDARVPLLADADATERRLSTPHFNLIRRLALQEAGITIAEHKRSMVARRLSRRLNALGLSNFEDYCTLLCSEFRDREIQPMVNALTTNKTDFFRESHHFDHLADVSLPAFTSRSRNMQKRLRIWSAGCSTGQEPYTIAMTMIRSVACLDTYDARILATDIDTEVLAKAERGSYTLSELQGIPHHLRNSFFSAVPRQDGAFRAAPELRGLVAFRQLNLHGPWPMKGPFDAIFCRNVVIYFDHAHQCRLFDRMADMLAPDGYLYVGHSESLFRVTTRFQSVGHSIYRKTS